MTRYRIIGSHDQPLGPSFEAEHDRDAESYLPNRLVAAEIAGLRAAVQRRDDGHWVTVSQWVEVADLV